MALIELYEGFFVDPHWVAVVKASNDADQCVLFTPGQSAVHEGFYIPFSAGSVVEQLNDASAEQNEEDESEDEEEEEEDEHEDDKEEEGEEKEVAAQE